MNKIDNYEENTVVSVAKGIGILLVLVGHFGYIPVVKRVIYLFHMPLFFFLSGYLFKDRKIKEFPGYVHRKVKSLYIPFIGCNLFAMIFHNLLCRIGIYSAKDSLGSISEVVKYIVKILMCIKMEDVVAPLWFLPVLMAVSIVYFVLNDIVGNEKIKTALIGLIFLFAYILVSTNRTGGLWRVMILVGTGLWMFHIGYIYKHYLEAKIREKIHAVPVVLVCIILEVILSFTTDINMIKMRFSNPIVFSIGAILGINIILWIAEKLQSKFLRYIGNNSLIVLEWHYWGAVLVTLLQVFIYKGTAKGIVTYQGAKAIWFLVYMACGIGFPLLILAGKKAINKFAMR